LTGEFGEKGSGKREGYEMFTQESDLGSLVQIGILYRS